MVADTGRLERMTGRQYRRGAVMGMTMAEAFVLIAFALLLLLAVWQWRVAEDRARFAPVEALDAPQMAAAAELAASLSAAQAASVAALAAEGRLDRAIELALAAGDSPLPADEGVWRFVDAGPMADLYDRAATLPQEAQAAMADLAARPPAELSATADLVGDGLDVLRSAGMADPAKLWRFIDSDELARLLEGAAELPDGLQQDLADMVEIGDPALIAVALAAARGGDPLRARLAGIGGTIAEAQTARAATVVVLRDRLGAVVAGLGGDIRPDGTIVLPETVSFEQGSADVRPAMAEFLASACEPWLGVLMRSDAPVAAARIEGHASPEWEGADADQAFRQNLWLSQQRSQAVLSACLDAIADPATRDWAHAHLAAVGYSSARPVIVGDAADWDQSRRVEFSVTFDESGLMDAVAGQVAEGLGTLTAPAE